MLSLPAAPACCPHAAPACCPHRCCAGCGPDGSAGLRARPGWRVAVERSSPEGRRRMRSIIDRVHGQPAGDDSEAEPDAPRQPAGTPAGSGRVGRAGGAWAAGGGGGGGGPEEEELMAPAMGLPPGWCALVRTPSSWRLSAVAGKNTFEMEEGEGGTGASCPPMHWHPALPCTGILPSHALAPCRPMHWHPAVPCTGILPSHALAPCRPVIGGLRARRRASPRAGPTTSTRPRCAASGGGRRCR